LGKSRIDESWDAKDSTRWDLKDFVKKEFFVGLYPNKNLLWKRRKSDKVG